MSWVFFNKTDWSVIVTITTIPAVEINLKIQGIEGIKGRKRGREEKDKWFGVYGV